MIQRKMASVALAIVGVAAGATLLSSSDASAKGCNGHVNQLEWGCAPWDNNNGPQYPHYKPEAQPAAKTATPPPVAAAQAQRPTAPAIATNGNGIVAQGGGNIVAQGGGNAVNKSGIVAQGGGNLKK